MKGEIRKGQQSTPADLSHVWAPTTTDRKLHTLPDVMGPELNVQHLVSSEQQQELVCFYLASGSCSCPPLDVIICHPSSLVTDTRGTCRIILV